MFAKLKVLFLRLYLKKIKMKKLLNFAIALVLIFTVGVTSSFAQAKKIAILNTEKILLLMPEKAKADTMVFEYQNELIGEYTAKEKALNDKINEFTSKQESYSQTMKQLKSDEIRLDQQRLQEFASTIEAELGEKQEKLYKPLMDKIINAAKEVSKEKGYSYVMDANSFLYFDEADLIDTLVKAKLGLK